MNKFTCDRCKQEKDGSEFTSPDGITYTQGYYRRNQLSWESYFNDGENIICDNCMHFDVRYSKYETGIPVHPWSQKAPSAKPTG